MTFWGGDVREKNNFLCYFYCEKAGRGHYQPPTLSAGGAVAQPCLRVLSRECCQKYPGMMSSDTTPPPAPAQTLAPGIWEEESTRNVHGVPRAAETPAGIWPSEFVSLI